MPFYISNKAAPAPYLIAFRGISREVDPVHMCSFPDSKPLDHFGMILNIEGLWLKVQRRETKEKVVFRKALLLPAIKKMPFPMRQAEKFHKIREHCHHLQDYLHCLSSSRGPSACSEITRDV
jgi:hypothetical protein